MEDRLDGFEADFDLPSSIFQPQSSIFFVLLRG